MRTSFAAMALVSACFALQAVASAKLPVVNVAAGSISAREMYGEVRTAAPVAVTASPLSKANDTPRTAVARSSAKLDVLVPQRPTTDIWARGTTTYDPPLRTPYANEFAIFTNDFELPEESLDIRATTPAVAAVPVVRTATAINRQPPEVAEWTRMDSAVPRAVVVRSARNAERAAAAPEMDAKLAKLDESYKKLEARINEMQTREESLTAWAPAAPLQRGAPEDVIVRRVVVPWEEDKNVKAVTEDVFAGAAHNPGPVDQFEYDGDVPLTKLSPAQLKKAFQKTYMSENKHLSAYQIDSGFDVVSSLSAAGFDSSRDLSEVAGIRPLEIKLGFREDDAALSRDNYNLLSEYASIVVANPKRAIQISIPERATRTFDNRRLAARRLAIVEQVLRDTGVADNRILPVLSQRTDDSFVLRVISSDQFETMIESRRDVFGDTIGNTKSVRSMRW